MKSAKEFWKEKFGEYPQTDADKLAVVMMAEYLADFKENVSGAKLIAAAPGLLEALVQLKEYCKYHNILLGSGIIHKVDVAIEDAVENLA